jgi:hypothetical protein
VSEEELSKEMNLKTDWTFFTREVAKMDAVIKYAIEMLIRFESKTNKKKLLRLDTLESVSNKMLEGEESSMMPSSQEQLILDTFFTEKIWRRTSQDMADQSERAH